MPTSPYRICIVTDELAGPDFNGGIGTACQGLASALAGAGHAVDVLYTRVCDGKVQCTVGAFADHVESYAHRGVRLRTIAQAGPWNDYPAKSFAAMNHLQGEHYDLVFFNDTHGTGFYPILSRRTGNPRLATTRMCVVTHSASQWIADLNGEPITRRETLRLFEMERRSIELSDVVFSPSAYLIEKYKSYGWTFPAETHVQRNIMPGSGRSRAVPGEHRPIDELVFFGRLERRKGIDLFCATLDRLKYVLQGRKVSFLGKDTVVGGLSSLEEVVKRSAGWPFEVQVMADYSREAALRYLQGGRRLAIMPSFEENSPCAIQECLELGIPFIASSGSGGEELIAPESRGDCCFVPTVASLSQKVLHTLENGAVTGRQSFDPEENRRSLIDWISDYLSRTASAASPGNRSKRIRSSLALVVMAPDGADQGGPIFESQEVTAAFRGGIERFTVSAGVSAAYDRFAAGIAQGSRDYVCIWDGALEPNAGWLLRAKNHLDSDADCVAVTGLATQGSAPELRDPPAHLSLLSVTPSLRQPIVGAARPLALLSQESNNGFVLLRGAAFSELQDCSPWDGTYARPKAADEWIDEMLQRLLQGGAKISLLPDLPASPRRARSFFEVYRAGAARRAALTAGPQLRPGSPATLISRLGIEKLADQQASQLVNAFLQDIAKQTKVQAHEWSAQPWASEYHLEKLAVAAFATGQVSLSKELLAYLASLKGSGSTRDAARVERFWEGRSERLCLARLLEQKTTHRSDAGIRSSIAIDSEDASIVFPVGRIADSRGLIAYRLDLSGFSSFSSTLRASGPEGMELWFYAGLSSLSSGRRLGVENVAIAGSEARLDFLVPEDLRGPCTFNLIIERRGEVQPSGDALAIWENPHFARESGRAS